MSKREALRLVALVVYFLFSNGAGAQGEYPDKLMVELLPNGQTMKLVNAFRFVDQRNQVWAVPAGAEVDGASIPRALWSIVGSPLTGKYRDASVIHDYYCTTKSQEWFVVHRVFREAMLASGVDNVQAAYMYWAVQRFGPRWDVAIPVGCQPNCYRSRESGGLGGYEPKEGNVLVVDEYTPVPPTHAELLNAKIRFEGSPESDLDNLLWTEVMGGEVALQLSLREKLAERSLSSRVMSPEEYAHWKQTRSRR